METSPYTITTGPEARDQIERVLKGTQIGVLGLSNQHEADSPPRAAVLKEIVHGSGFATKR